MARATAVGAALLLTSALLAHGQRLLGVAEVALPPNARGGPMTYVIDGKQYVAFAVGSASIPEELIALALP